MLRIILIFNDTFSTKSYFRAISIIIIEGFIPNLLIPNDFTGNLEGFKFVRNLHAIN